MHSKISLIAASALFLGTVQGHMIMKTPVPYGPPPDSSPLLADGSNFPCKASAYTVQTENVMAIGEPQTLSFTGSAVHGGGSCQVSLTTDRQPTKNSKWMVIKSIEGGCPASVSGNLPADPNGSGASTFQYTIPDGIAPGQYTIAWTWLNKIGNREFYMNCGPATVTAAKKKRYVPEGVSIVRKQTSFPDMFVANLAGINSCATPETFDYNYPNPGAVVQSAGTGPYTQLACGAAGSANVPAASPTAAGSASTPDTSSAAVPTSSSDNVTIVSPGAAQPTGASTQSVGGVFASGAASPTAGSASAPSAAASAIPSASAPTPSAAAPSAPASTGTSSAGQQTAGAPCSNEGEWICLGKSYQRCASGRYSPVMPLASGTSCTPGTSMSINIAPGKRSVVRKANSFKA